MNNVDKSLLKNIEDNEFSNSDAINIRKNGKCIERKDTKYINIKSKDNNSGINVYVDDNVKFGIIHIPVIITESGITDTVYNDFYIGKNSNVVIIAGCGIHNDKHKTSTHNGINKLHLG